MLFPIITFDSLGLARLCGPFERTREEREADEARADRERDIEPRRQAGCEDDFASENVRSWRKEACWR
jgi:hypothetical protein